MGESKIKFGFCFPQDSSVENIDPASQGEYVGEYGPQVLDEEMAKIMKKATRRFEKKAAFHRKKAQKQLIKIGQKPKGKDLSYADYDGEYHFTRAQHHAYLAMENAKKASIIYAQIEHIYQLLEATKGNSYNENDEESSGFDLSQIVEMANSMGLEVEFEDGEEAEEFDDDETYDDEDEDQ